VAERTAASFIGAEKIFALAALSAFRLASLLFVMSARAHIEYPAVSFP
jgi:hypothetical protein